MGVENQLPYKEGLKIGDRDKNVILLKNFLFQPELLSGVPSETLEIFDENTRKSLIEFQNSANIPATGNLDSQTLEAIWTPKCPYGDTDVAAFTKILHTGWPKNTNLTWAILANPGDKMGFVTSAINFAINEWKETAHVPINFSQVSMDNAPEITVEFDNLKVRMEQEKQPWDNTMVAVTLLKGFKGEAPRRTMQVIFDGLRPWTSSGASVAITKAYDLFANMAHEFGHVCGLNHSQDASALMFPFRKNGARFCKLDDILGIKAMYGI